MKALALGWVGADQGIKVGAGKKNVACMYPHIEVLVVWLDSPVAIGVCGHMKAAVLGWVGADQGIEVGACKESGAQTRRYY